MDIIKKIKEGAANEKTNIIFVILLLIGIVVAWDMRSNSNVSVDRITTNTVREQYKSVGDQQQRAGEAIAASKSIITEIKQSNNNIRSTNNEIESTINDSRELNRTSGEILKDCKRILGEARTSGKI
jgi:predicted negative regulator of RcsB-dependent stress response